MNDVVAALESLRTEAPSSLLPAVLADVGLADRYCMVSGPTGPLYVAWSDRGVTACVPAEIVGDDAGFTAHHPRSAVRVSTPPSHIARPLDKALATGRLGALPVDLDALGEFQRAVLEKCAEIPPGEIRPYGWIAREIGNPGAVRAVGTALGRNPIPILIPCHRVVRTDGHIGRYAWGTPMKKRLLETEGLDPSTIEAEAGRGVRYIGSDTTGIFCFPSCRHAKRVTPQHRIEFRSEDDAVASGYRACKVCRPAA